MGKDTLRQATMDRFHLKDNIQDQGNLIFQEMIRNIKISQSKSKEVYTM